MAKTIKFNLICDGFPVRTLADLQEHFSVEDVLGYYKSGLLSRWLKVRGYSDQLEKVEKLSAKEDLAIVKELIKVFAIETDDEVVEEHTYILGYKEQQRKLNDEFCSKKMSREELIQAYHKGYDDAIKRILEHKDDMAVIKAAIKEINDNYRSLFDVDYRMLFNIFYNHAPMALFVMLMHDHMRAKYLVEESHDDAQVSEQPVLAMTRQYRIRQLAALFQEIAEKSRIQAGNEESEVSIDVESVDRDVELIEADRKEMLRMLNKIVDDTFMLQSILGDYLELCGLKTAPYERALEDKGRFMVLKIGKGDKVHSYGNIDKEYEYDQIASKFVILDGLCYMSNSDTTSVFYLEV